MKGSEPKDPLSLGNLNQDAKNKARSSAVDSMKMGICPYCGCAEGQMHLAECPGSGSAGFHRFTGVIEYIWQAPAGEKIVGITTHRDQVYVATDTGVYVVSP